MTERDPTGSERSAGPGQVASALHSWLAAGDVAGSTLLWTAVPTALLALRAPTSPVPMSRRSPGTRSAKSMLTLLSRVRGSSVVAVDDVLFEFDRGNPAATVEPVIAALGQRLGAPPRPVEVRPSPTTLVRELREAADAAAAVSDELPGGLPEGLEEALYAAARATARATSALRVVRPRLVVVASQHSTASRAFIRRAQEEGIGVAYLPHAPVADNHQYRDLPTQFAGLRGAREVDFYRGLGVTGPLDVVGNPQVTVRPPIALPPNGPLVFAPSPRPPAAIAVQVEALRFADHVVVSPHPRMVGKAEYEGLWPSHWNLHEGRTIELLAAGTPCVIQSSSGVAWEAMAHGVPVIELAQDGVAAPQYPLLQEPFARACDPDGLPAGVAQARRDAADQEFRSATMAWAREWCEITGDAAARRAAEWLARCREAPVSAPLLDHWRRPEVAGGGR